MMQFMRELIGNEMQIRVYGITLSTVAISLTKIPKVGGMHVVLTEFDTNWGVLLRLLSWMHANLIRSGVIHDVRLFS